jgi:hypothetical protein
MTGDVQLAALVASVREDIKRGYGDSIRITKLCDVAERMAAVERLREVASATREGAADNEARRIIDRFQNAGRK